jgi:uncharacterized protein (TIGR03066 family)
MHWSRYFMATLIVLCLALVGTAGSDTAKKLIGVWELSKADNSPPGAVTVEFTKDNKLKLRIKANDKELKIDGTYELKDNDIVSMLTFEGQTKTETNKIKKLTEKELVIEDEKGKVEEYKRAK